MVHNVFVISKQSLFFLESMGCGGGGGGNSNLSTGAESPSLTSMALQYSHGHSSQPSRPRRRLRAPAPITPLFFPDHFPLLEVGDLILALGWFGC